LTPEDAPVAISVDPTSFSLTYAVRPVEKLALQLTITASADVGGATIDIDGDDWLGNHQDDDSIDISNANSVPVVTTTYWSAIDANGITVDGIDDGTTIQVTQPQWGVIWDHGNGHYTIDSTFQIGDGGTSTYFMSTDKELVVWTDHLGFFIKSSAELQLGELSGDWASNGVAWVINRTTAWPNIISDGEATAVFKVYGSAFFDDNTVQVPIKDGTTDFRNSIFMGGASSTGWAFYVSELSIKRSFIASCRSIELRAAPDTMDVVYFHNIPAGIGSYADDVLLIDPDITESGPPDVFVLGISETSSLLVRDPITPIATPEIYIKDGCFVVEQYTCNIEVADKDGTLLDGVVVDCEDQNTDAVWAAGTQATGDTDTGKIDEQIIDFKKWTSRSETLTEYSPHKFTLSKAGYETLILEDITVDSPINWHLELKGKQQITVGGNDYFSDDS